MTGDLVGYFGFGSLVNRKTLRTDFIDAVPARLHGWQRHWQSRTRALPDHVAQLSVHEVPGKWIDGLIVVDRAENLPAVDYRERDYDRVVISPENLEFHNGKSAGDLPDYLIVYVAKENNHISPDGPLLQSYLDAVMQGFLLEYGQRGISHFLESTVGFNRQIILDRREPRYSRPVQLGEDEERMFDSGLRNAGVIGI